MKYKKYGHHKKKKWTGDTIANKIRIANKMIRKGNKDVRIYLKPGLYHESIVIPAGCCLSGMQFALSEQIISMDQECKIETPYTIKDLSNEPK